jgi:hypothetical protein
MFGTSLYCNICIMYPVKKWLYHDPKNRVIDLEPQIKVLKKPKAKNLIFSTET